MMDEPRERGCRRGWLLATLLALATPLLPACGQMGPLVLPDETAGADEEDDDSRDDER